MLWFFIFYLVMMAASAQFVIIPLYSNENGLFETIAPDQYKEWQKMPNAVKTTITLIVSFFWPLLLIATLFAIIIQAGNGPNVQ